MDRYGEKTFEGQMKGLEEACPGHCNFCCSGPDIFLWKPTF
ncbi:hypothetical protein ACFPFV_02835 [Salinicoccus siamensis]